MLVGLALNSRRFESALILSQGRTFTRNELYKAIKEADEVDRFLAEQSGFFWVSRPQFPMRTFNRYVKEFRAKGILRRLGSHRKLADPGRPASLYLVNSKALLRQLIPERGYRKEVVARAKNVEATRVIPIPRAGFRDKVALAALFAILDSSGSGRERGARARARKIGSLLPWSGIAKQLRFGEMIVIGPPIPTSPEQP